jgi:hypothetical protein
VPELAAKPIVDNDISVNAMQTIDPYQKPLEALGWPFRFDP